MSTLDDAFQLTPNQRRLDVLISQNKQIISELTKFNANLAVVGKALINMAASRSIIQSEIIAKPIKEKKVKKAVDRV